MGETAPAAVPLWQQYPATNTSIMTLFRGRASRVAVMVTQRADFNRNA
jgi:hypothetical protein